VFRRGQRHPVRWRFKSDDLPDPWFFGDQYAPQGALPDPYAQTIVG
jgi:hypothetical protein